MHVLNRVSDLSGKKCNCTLSKPICLFEVLQNRMIGTKFHQMKFALRLHFRILSYLVDFKAVLNNVEAEGFHYIGVVSELGKSFEFPVKGVLNLLTFSLVKIHELGRVVVSSAPFLHKPHTSLTSFT